MRGLAAAALAALLAGCAATGGPPPNPDPWESLNRATYRMNDTLDRQFLKPVAQTYAEGVPAFMQEGVANFFDNLQDLGIGLNNVLQGKLTEGGSDFARFAVNSVFGIGGLWDVATPMGLEKHDEDLGQTLGRWGVPPGPYFVIPIFGPSTVRDAPARWIDPSLAYNRQIADVALRNSLYTLDAVRNRAGLLKAERIVDEAALDRYTFTRDAWLQRRRHHVYDGRPPRDPEDE